jgi:large subunit ribosomal protein L13
MKTYSAKPADLKRRWLVVDAEGRTLGRLASQVAHVLKGKHRPTFTAHIDTGDHVVVINASKIALTGKKVDTEKYFHHTMYPGGAGWTSLRTLLEKHPERVVFDCVRGMLPKTKLGRAMISKLKVYAGPEHPHAAQQPTPWNPPHPTSREA